MAYAGESDRPAAMGGPNLYLLVPARSRFAGACDGPAPQPLLVNLTLWALRTYRNHLARPVCSQLPPNGCTAWSRGVVESPCPHRSGPVGVTGAPDGFRPA